MLNKRCLSNFYNTHIAVAVSGGRDSMCLLDILASNYRAKFKSITVLTVDHRLREESSKEAEFVKKYANDLGLDCHILVWEDSLKKLGNIQEKAREARFGMMRKFCTQHEIKALFIGHTKDDQAETVFYRIKRGTGIAGLAAMDYIIQHDEKIAYVRPLLDLTRDDITSYAASHNIPFVDDPSNLNEKYDRVKIRKYLNSFPDSKDFKNRLALLASNARRSNEYIEIKLNEFMSNNVKPDILGYMKVARDKLLAEHEEIQLRFINRIVDLFSKPKHPQRLSSLQNLLKSLQNNRSAVLGGVEFIIEKDEIWMLREVKQTSFKVASNVWDKRFYVTNLPFDCEISYIKDEDLNLIKKLLLDKSLKTKAKIINSIPCVYNNNGMLQAIPLLDYDPYNLGVELRFILQ